MPLIRPLTLCCAALLFAGAESAAAMPFTSGGGSSVQNLGCSRTTAGNNLAFCVALEHGKDGVNVVLSFPEHTGAPKLVLRKTYGEPGMQAEVRGRAQAEKKKAKPPVPKKEIPRIDFSKIRDEHRAKPEKKPVSSGAETTKTVSISPKTTKIRVVRVTSPGKVKKTLPETDSGDGDAPVTSSVSRTASKPAKARIDAAADSAICRTASPVFSGGGISTKTLKSPARGGKLVQSRFAVYRTVVHGMPVTLNVDTDYSAARRQIIVKRYADYLGRLPAALVEMTHEYQITVYEGGFGIWYGGRNGMQIYDDAYRHPPPVRGNAGFGKAGRYYAFRTADHLFTHEAGHAFLFWRPAGGLTDWETAMMRDGIYPTQYAEDKHQDHSRNGTRNYWEDFAEFFMLYWLSTITFDEEVRADLEKRFPARTGFMRNFLAGELCMSAYDNRAK